MDRPVHSSSSSSPTSTSVGATAGAKRPAEDDPAAAPPAAQRPKADAEGEALKRSERLESNRTAARESRRRKKVLVEELQRSVIFFTRANAQIRRKNEGLAATLAAARDRVREGGNADGGAGHAAAPAPPGVEAAGEERPAPTLPPAPAPVPDPAAAATAQAQAMTQSNNQLMANWLAMAQAVPNPMAMQMPMGMGMFNPAFHPAAMTHPGLMGMNTAGLGHPFLGHLQASAAATGGSGGEANATGGFSFEA